MLLKTIFRPKAVIQDIHNEFDIACENFLNDVKAIIGETDIVNKGKRLRAIGFEKSFPVKEGVRLDAIKSQADNAAKFTNRYPLYKFIRKEDVERICKKYRLICGRSCDYIGDMPEKNLKEIEAFRVDQNDIDYSHERSFWTWDRRHGIPLMICAPKKQFDTTNMELSGSFLSPKDPIVLCPVTGGFLIVTKWGLEASDELVKNEIEN